MSRNSDIIPEVNDGGRNLYFRESPRQEIHIAILYLIEFLPDHVSTGMLYEIMSDPQTWRSAVINASEDGSPELKARARLILDLTAGDGSSD